MANAAASQHTERPSSPSERLAIGDIDLEIIRRGKGRPLLLLHGFQNIDLRAAFLPMLGDHAEIIAPSHPGFGRSSRPADVETIYDLVHCYLALLDALPYDKLTLMGFSFGGWLAAEIAVKATRRIDKLVLVDALGIKISDRETPDIFDVFNKHPKEVRARSWHDPDKCAPNYDDMEDDELVNIANNRDALCRYGWHPYLHNPQLKRWLGNIKAPTLVLWGASDGIVKPAYGEAYAKLIPGARFDLIPAAGHHPYLEQPKAFVERVSAFLQS
jgi:pimeloyl-ACP methyl ester carboxylesterase